MDSRRTYWGLLVAIGVSFIASGCADNGSSNENGVVDLEDDLDSDTSDEKDEASDTSVEHDGTESTDTADNNNTEGHWSALCADDDRIGSFDLFTVRGDESDYTKFYGTIYESVTPASVPELLMDEGQCVLVGPRNPFCDPGCTGGEECGLDGACHPKPLKKSVGTVTVTGMDVAVSLSPRPIILEYSQQFSDPFPGFTANSTLTMVAEGDELDGFTLETNGVELLTSELSLLSIESGVPALVKWDPPTHPSDGDYVHLELNVNTHGALLGWVECAVSDTGSFEIPESLVSKMITLGMSGFPKLVISRRNSNLTSLSEGCVEFTTKSDLTVDVEIPGLNSCKGNADCADGETCSAELVCEKL